MDTKGVTEIARSLTTNCTLRTLNLNYNGIGSKEAIEIANILESNYTLTAINLVVENDNIVEIINRNKKIFENIRFHKTKNAMI